MQFCAILYSLDAYILLCILYNNDKIFIMYNNMLSILPSYGFILRSNNLTIRRIITIYAYYYWLRKIYR